MGNAIKWLKTGPRKSSPGGLSLAMLQSSNVFENDQMLYK